ncbi:MAG: DUF4292 domain-containing protein [Balneolaceae bacterium]
MKKPLPVLLTLLFLLGSGCRSISWTETETGELSPSELGSEEFAALVPDYLNSLQTLQGSGQALISQPGGSDRVHLDFYSSREESLVHIRNRLGMEGAQILVGEDSVLVYNRIDNIAEKVSIRSEYLSDVGTLATVNLATLFSPGISKEELEAIYESRDHYVGVTESNSRITVDRGHGTILEIQHPEEADSPYRRVIYEEYGDADGFTLPRKITIFSQDGRSRVTFLARFLQANHPLPELTIRIPEETPILR